MHVFLICQTDIGFYGAGGLSPNAKKTLGLEWAKKSVDVFCL